MSYYVFLKDDKDLVLNGPLSRDELTNIIDSAIYKDIAWVTSKKLNEIDWLENKNIGFIIEGKTWLPIMTPDIVDCVVVNKKILVRYE